MDKVKTKFLNIALFLFLSTLKALSQEWSEPVIINPSQSDRYSSYPDFCIDNEGNIHCVWSTSHGTNFYRIWYSKSEDNGITWTPPYNASENNSKWMAEPQIVSDNQGVLHLVYIDDAAGDSKIIYKTNDGIYWSEPDTLNEGYFGAFRNRLVIDHNDRLYCFWFVSIDYDKMFYRFKDIGMTEWSNVIMPYDTAFFFKVIVGPDNSLSIAGYSKIPSEIKKRLTFYKYDNSLWSKPELVSPQTTASYSDMSLDTQLFPHFVWTQYSVGNGTGIDSSLYRCKNAEGWQPMEFIQSDVLDRSIILDNFDHKYIVEVEELNGSYYLVEYQKSNEQWEANILDSNNYIIYNNRLLCKNNYIYLINAKIDTMIIGLPISSNIIFRKKEVLATSVNYNEKAYSAIKIYPNPSKNEVTCRFTIAESQNISARIYEQNGNEIRPLFEGEMIAGEIKLTWDGKDSCGDFVSKGIYILSIKVNHVIITKKIIIY